MITRSKGILAALAVALGTMAVGMGCGASPAALPIPGAPLLAGNWQGTLTVTLTAQKDNEAPESGSAPTTYRMTFNLDGKPAPIPAILSPTGDDSVALDITKLPPVGQQQTEAVNTIDANGNGKVGTAVATVTKANYTDTSMDLELDTQVDVIVKQDGLEFPSTYHSVEHITATIVDDFTLQFQNQSTYDIVGPNENPPTANSTTVHGILTFDASGQLKRVN
jgi:hypothetical protein